MDLQETLKMIGLMLAPAFFSLLGMGALGSPAVAVLGELSAKTNKKVFFDKYGQQTGSLGLILLAFLVVIYGVGIGISLYRYPRLIEQSLNPASPFFTGAVLLAVFAVAALIYFLTWKSMRQAKAPHIILGLIAALSAIGAVAVVTPAKLFFNLSQGSPSQEALATASAMALPLSAMYGVLVLAAAASLSLAYLVIRRNKDDFGRDYYSFAMKLAARWSMLPMIGFMACQGWLYARLPENIQLIILGTPLAYVWAGVVILGAVNVGLWILIARNESPLRMKGPAFLSVFIFWAMHALNATLFVNFMTML
ncbi:hypothetical protein [Pseudodesulfovibrio portus]|uniref:Uncharacterized protein n=1 Tax=Pseudodesulfovibrio portus TaxID=231439 RepID=A0ABM8AVY5_9BACT|nr:hypothetical protein [Pseudodesulfovibrio portus]BDQ35619.1 hypothetical protein JCM14722_31610 [Pseudodesulfovibrio portus]